MKIEVIKAGIFSTVLIFMFALTSQAQTLGEFNVKTSEQGKGQLKKAPKKIYIASFNVYFEIYKEAIDFKRGGYQFGGGETSNATARAAVGLNGIDGNDIQQKTNQMYNEFVADLKKNGLEIISPDVAGKIEAYEGWERASGPFVGESGIPGVLLSLPAEHAQYFRGMKANGKVKKGFAGLGDIGLQPKLSDQLDDAIIADVNLYFMFAEEGNSMFKGNAAKVKILTNLRMVGDFTVQAPNDKGILKGQQTFNRVSSTVMFNQGKKAMYSPVAFTTTLKKPLEVDGIIKKEKVVAFQKQGSSTPTSFSGISLMDTGDKFSKTANWIEVDSKKYANGLYMAAKKILDASMQPFIENLK